MQFFKNVLLVLNNILSSLTKTAFLAKQRSKNSGLILMHPPRTGDWWASPREVFMPLTYPAELWFSASGARECAPAPQLPGLSPPPFGIHGIAGTSPLTIAFCLSIFIPTAFHVVLHSAHLPFFPFYSIHHGFEFFFSFYIFPLPNLGIAQVFPLYLYIILSKTLLELPFLCFSEYRS